MTQSYLNQYKKNNYFVSAVATFTTRNHRHKQYQLASNHAHPGSLQKSQYQQKQNLNVIIGFTYAPAGQG